MPEMVADPPDLPCYLLFPGDGIEESQRLAPDPLLSPARDARGRFAEGSSGNPRGRPRGIPNPGRRMPDLVARPLTARAMAELLDRKPHLLMPLAGQLLPPPAPAIDPAERLGIELSSLRTTEDLRQALSTVLAAVSQGEIAPAEAARIARRGRARLRSARRHARLERRLMPETDRLR
ncbi:MAG TPA: DUF5681 domain-containing protein [Stellaceae bacterium]